VRVLILAPEPPTRGILHSLVALGIEPIVARPSGDSEIDGLVRFERVQARGDASDLMNLRWSRKSLRTLVRDTRPDLLHIVGDPWTPTAEAGAAAARDLKLPYALIGTSSIGGPSSITSRWQARRVRDGAAVLGGTVRSAMDHLAREAPDTTPRGVVPATGLVIPPPPRARGVPEIPVFGVVGRIVPERGLDLLLDALAEVYGDWRLRIVGTGPAQESLEAQAQRLGLAARLEWMGGLPRHALADFWEGIDVLVAPSRSTSTWVEPTGAVVLEAMAHGIAPIATRCGALPDVVGSGGLIVDENDRPALARVLQKLVQEPERIRTLGASARQQAIERFGDRPVAEQLVALWSRIPRGG
jgi:glycosyltransferase involved in cell wall biosynthesis